MRKITGTVSSLVLAAALAVFSGSARVEAAAKADGHIDPPGGGQTKLPPSGDEASFRDYFFRDGREGPALYVPMSLEPDSGSIAADEDGNIVYTRNFDGGALTLAVERRPVKNLNGVTSSPDGAAELIAALEGIDAGAVSPGRFGPLEEKLGVPVILAGYAGKGYEGPGEDSTDFLMYGPEYVFRVHIRADEKDEDKYLTAVLALPEGMQFIE
jgi:hypothetical protein